MSPINFDEQHWLKEISDALATPDPTLSNQKITLVHYQLSHALHAVTGDTGANFHTWAVWGSRKAGVTIRQEDLSEALRNATIVAGIVGLLVGLTISSLTIAFWLKSWPWLIVVPSSLFGMICGALTGRWIATYSRREASRLILEGNQIVLDDIGRQTARFVAMFHDQDKPDLGRLSTFLNELRPGDTKSGGQDLLRRAFSHYYNARYSEGAKQKHESTYFANCLAVLHEHIRLEPYIKRSMPLIIRKCATKRLMQFDVGSVKLRVSEEVPKLEDLQCPRSLEQLHDKELIEFLEGPNGWGSTREKARANDWTNIHERMKYIVQLFRVMHLEGSVFSTPFAITDDAGESNLPRV
jgi:hypothetical protein